MIGLWIALASGAGAVTRLAVDGEIRARRRSDVPWATVLINITGSLLLGVLTGLVLFHGAATDLKVIAGTGFCGGYTTFSTASFETARLLQQRAFTAAAINTVLTLTGCLAAAGIGLGATRL